MRFSVILLGLWGLPYPLIEAVANHHVPNRVKTLEYGVLAAVHIADALVHEMEAPGHNQTESHPGLDMEFIARLDLMGRVETCREQVRQNFKSQETR